MDIASILEQFQCPVCFNHMYPPIKMCILGHNICNDCDTRVNRCPICRSIKSNGRNYGMEAIYNFLVFPCKNLRHGCIFKGFGRTIEKHLAYCFYSFKKCPLRLLDCCRWKGRKIDVISHCQQGHPRNTFCTNQQKLLYPISLKQKIWGGPMWFYYMVFKAYEELFVYVCLIDTFLKCMVNSVTYLGTEDEADSYYIYCKFNDDVQGRIRCQSNAFVLNNNNGGVLIYDLEVLKNACIDEGLPCTISIIKSDQEEPQCSLLEELKPVIPQASLYPGLCAAALDENRPLPSWLGSKQLL